MRVGCPKDQEPELALGNPSVLAKPDFTSHCLCFLGNSHVTNTARYLCFYMLQILDYVKELNSGIVSEGSKVATHCFVVVVLTT